VNQAKCWFHVGNAILAIAAWLGEVASGDRLAW